ARLPQRGRAARGARPARLGRRPPGRTRRARPGRAPRSLERGRASRPLPRADRRPRAGARRPRARGRCGGRGSARRGGRLVSHGALVVTYHAVEPGPSPICVDPDLFRRQLDELVGGGARSLTVRELGERLAAGTLPDRAVALTFDDGFASVVRTAAPLLRERGLTATVFCVAGHLGGRSDWATQPSGSPRLDLAGADELAKLAAAGFEIGSHSSTHMPLAGAGAEALRQELDDSRRRLEDAVGVEVTSFAHPYGVPAAGGA